MDRVINKAPGNGHFARKQFFSAGFTLVEMLTALVIGSILMLGAITIMINSPPGA